MGVPLPQDSYLPLHLLPPTSPALSWGRKGWTVLPILLAKLMDWPLPFAVTTLYLAQRSGLVSIQPHLHFHRLIFHLLFQMGLPSLKQVLYFCLPSLWNVFATDDNPTLL